MKALHNLTGIFLVIVLVGAMTTLVSLFEYKDQDSLIMLFLLPIMFASINFGVREGLFASFLSFLSIDYFFTKPIYGFVPVSLREAIPLFTFIVTALTVHWLIVKRRTLEREVGRCLREKEVADEARKIQTSILNNISHEIRTPLTSLLGFTEFLSEGTQDMSADEIEGMKRSIRNSSSYLTRLVDRLLELSQAESGYPPLESNEITIEHFAQELLAKYSIQAARKGLSFTIEHDRDLPPIFHTDKAKLLSLLDNVIDNAIKFTERGHIKILISPLVTPTGPSLLFKIEDTGIGIDKKALPQLFEPFFQADLSHSRSYGGAGLGLAHARKIARSMGGDLKLNRTTTHAGACFEANIPEIRVPSYTHA